MYFHLFAALLFFGISLSIPAIPENYMVAVILSGFIALLIFLKDLSQHLNNKFLIQARKAENENIINLSSFKGRFVSIRSEESPLSDEFTFMIFHDGAIDIPLFCRNHSVIQKSVHSSNELIVYYKDYILVNVEEIEKTPNR
jgi:predicted membrane protein